MELSQFILSSNEAGSVEELYGLLEDALGDLCGYDRVIFSLMSDHPSLGLSAGHGIMRNYPDDWMKHYAERGYEHLDPVRRFGFRHVGPFIWDSLPLVMDLTPRQALCMNECREAGFHDGAAVCLRGLTGELGGIGVASSTGGRRESAKDMRYRLGMFNAVAQQFYVVFCSLHEKEAPLERRQVVLTQREIDVMREMALARKDDAIAFKLNLTKHGVDYHIRNILRKLNAPNRMFAVMKAVNSGLLGLDEAAFIRRASRRGRPRSVGA
jgi:DNA-binding CsgD family transcriptional regulator